MSVRVQLRRDAGRLGPASGPWIRAKLVRGTPRPGDATTLAEVVDHDGQTVAWGLYSEHSAIAVRVLRWGSEPVADDWLRKRVSAAIEGRARLGLPCEDTTGVRLVNSEGDGLPGLVVDRYGEDSVVVLSTQPMVARRDGVVATLRAQLGGRIHVLQPEAAAKRERFEAGTFLDEAASGGLDALRYREHGLSLEVAPPPTQKTGAYLDQRANRRVVAELAARVGGPLLDIGCHTGGFSLAAAQRGIEAVGVDQSASALARAQANAERNGLTGLRFVAADMFGRLDDPALAGPFGAIVLDPPKLAARRSDAERAVGAMRRLVMNVAPRLRPGGVLVMCSCSHHVGADQLEGIALHAATPSRAWVRIAALGADVDHPVAPGHREGEYLRVAVFQARDA